MEQRARLANGKKRFLAAKNGVWSDLTYSFSRGEVEVDHKYGQQGIIIKIFRQKDS